TGVNNTGYGYGALLNNVTGFQNTGLGMYADVTAGNLRNATAIGSGAKVNASNKVRIGNAAVTKIEGQVPFSTPSDGRYKFNVREDVSGLAFILKLRPVTYQFDVSRFDNLSQDAALVAYKQASEVRRTGFIAQEVQIAAQEAKYDFSGIGIPQNAADHYSLSYESFVVPLVKAVQEQQNIILAQKAQILQLQKKSETELAQLKDELRNQQQQINLLLKEIRTISNRAQKMYTVVK
ncbi:MAG TPA: tail fiber domain-containing protein, partial [Chitinophagaceae bacterium]|nr:tail fiber domain-containing protein [Chitinophagaceae bacterium]